MPDRLAPKSAPPRPTNGRLALRFISGKYQGGEFPLEENREIVIGRSSDLDMVLVEEMVSRRHAKIVSQDGAVTIEDLGSTNGTFVNGEKIQRANLQEGDRVLIGTSILKLVTVPTGQESGKSLESVARQRAAAARSARPTTAHEAPRMSGSLDEIPLPDLMQLFGTSRKSGVLVLRTESNVGRLYLKDGIVYYTSIEGQPEIRPVKAAYRMLDWKNGVFELEPPDPTEFSDTVELTAQEMLMEGFRQLDELNNIRDRLPDPSARLALKTPLKAPLHELEPTHLEVLQLALNSSSVQVLFDRAETTDLKTAEILLSLMKRGYLRER